MRCLFIFLILLTGSVLLKAQTDTVFNQTDANNFKQGYWKKSYPNGKLMYRGFFRDDKPVGEMRRYYESGALKALLVYEDKSVFAHARMFYEDGQPAAEGWYYNSLKDSTWDYYSYYDHTLTASETYNKGKKNGSELHFYSNGHLSERITWVNDRKSGAWEQYFINDVLKLKGNYLSGKLEGEFLVNYDNGKPYLSGNYVNDTRHGKWTFFKEDGITDIVLEYLNGKTPDEEKLNNRQQEIFRMIDENEGKFEEPDETNFLTPVRQ